MSTPVPQCPVRVWHHCYEDSWKGYVTDESFAHPAKMARGLLRRILQHGFAQGWWKKGDVIGEPFGGIGSTALEGAYMGLKVISNELEPEFVKIALANLQCHRWRWETLGYPQPIFHQGDSRRFDEIVRDAGAVLTSPPFTSDQPCAAQSRLNGNIQGAAKRNHGFTTQGNIQLCREGVLDAAITSPPYATIAAGAGGLNHLPPKENGQQTGRAKGASQSADSRYGKEPGQIAGTAEGEVDAVLTSPPWEKNVEGHLAQGKLADPMKAKRGKGCSDEARARQIERDAKKTYGTTEGQIGREERETYWQSMKMVYASVYRALKPGGVACIVVKDYVRDKKRVRLCDETLRLLCYLGFESVERIHAMLVTETSHVDLFDGQVTKKKERKSFFRRLAEKGMSADDERRIDFEEVIVVRKPA